MADAPRKRADGGLVDQNGASIAESGFAPATTYKTQEGWNKDADDQRQAEADRSVEGTANRSVGEHILAAGRAVFEGGKFRDAVSKRRDPVNPLYDRRQGPQQPQSRLGDVEP